MQSVSQLINIIRVQCDRTSVDYENELASYDRKRNGIISPVSLHRWISSLGINLSAQQVQEIANAYRKEDGVEWEPLAQAITQSKEKTKEFSTRTPPCVEQLRLLGQQLLESNQTLRDALSPYDASNRGLISPDNFYRALGFSPVMRDIVKYYADTVTGYIDYIRLQADIQTVGVPKRDPDAPVTDLPDCFEDLARYIKSRSVDLYMLFRRIDATNVGKVQEPVFSSAVSSIGISIKPSYLKEIVACFTDPETHLSNYKQFIATVENYKPRMTETVKMATLKSEQGKTKINPDELIDNLRATIRSRRINVRDYFATVEREGYGDTVPVRVFVQIIESMRGSLSQEEIAAIAEKFLAANNQVDYNAFIRYITPQTVTRTLTKDDVIPRLRKFLEEQHRYFAALAQRYDRENSGCISPNQLISVFQLLKFDISNPEIALLCNIYPGKVQGSVSWKDIAEAVDPEVQPRTKRFADNDEIPRKDPKLIGKAPKQVNDVLLAVKNYVARQNVSLERIFASYDKRGVGYISSAEFDDALHDARVPLNQSDIRVVQSYFRIQSTPCVDYREFLDSVRLAEPEPEPQPEPETPRQREVPTLPPSVRNFIRRFKSFAQTRRISPRDIFVPYDTTKQGVIQVYKVPSAFSMVQFQSSRAELEDLCSVFRDPRKNEIFHYVLFCKAVDAEDITTEEARSAIANDPISADVNREALTTCLQIHEKLAQRRRRISSVFVGVTTDTIPNSEFIKRLDNLPIILTAGQINSLFRKYRYGITDDIRWKDFCEDVEKSRTIGDGF